MWKRRNKRYNETIIGAPILDQKDDKASPGGILRGDQTMNRVV